MCVYTYIYTDISHCTGVVIFSKLNKIVYYCLGENINVESNKEKQSTLVLSFFSIYWNTSLSVNPKKIRHRHFP